MTGCAYSASTGVLIMEGKAVRILLGCVAAAANNVMSSGILDMSDTSLSRGIYPRPACMAPDGADPCEGYHAALKRIAELESQLASAEQPDLEALMVEHKIGLIYRPFWEVWQPLHENVGLGGSIKTGPIHELEPLAAVKALVAKIKEGGE